MIQQHHLAMPLANVLLSNGPLTRYTVSVLNTERKAGGIPQLQNQRCLSSIHVCLEAALVVASSECGAAAAQSFVTFEGLEADASLGSGWG